MDKKIMIGIGAVAVLIIIILFFTLSGETTNELQDASSTQNAEDAGSATSASDEEEKYAEFEAELTCELLGATSAEDIAGTMEKTASIMEKYGYDNEEYNRLKAKYGENDDFKASIASEMEKMCPELVP